MPIYSIGVTIKQQAECDICEEGLFHSVDTTVENDGFNFQEMLDIKEYLKTLGWVIFSNVAICLNCTTNMDCYAISKLLEKVDNPKEIMKQLFRNREHLGSFVLYHDIDYSLSDDEIIDIYINTRIH